MLMAEVTKQHYSRRDFLMNIVSAPRAIILLVRARNSLKYEMRMRRELTHHEKVRLDLAAGSLL